MSLTRFPVRIGIPSGMGIMIAIGSMIHLFLPYPQAVRGDKRRQVCLNGHNCQLPMMEGNDLDMDLNVRRAGIRPRHGRVK
ncbi:hypothetical protein BN871_IF_00080, partial [Paenibacillus sp. P22]